MTTSKSLLTTLDIGSHINARFQVRLEAEAKHKLYAVACKPLLGKGFSIDCAQEVVVLSSSATARNTITAWHGPRALCTPRL